MKSERLKDSLQVNAMVSSKVCLYSHHIREYMRREQTQTHLIE